MSDSPQPTPHQLYFMKDGVTFLVENTLFRVPRYMLENTSPVLATLLSNPTPASDAQPIFLEGVLTLDFERLLAFLYPLTPSSPLSPLPSLSESHWISILRLSTKFEMTALRVLSMHTLSQVITNPLTKIRLGREYDHMPWVKEGFTMLCVRREALTVDEALGLTKEDVVKCASAREEIRTQGLGMKTESDLVGREREKGWRALVCARTSRRITGTEKGLSVGNDYDESSNNRIVRQIVNHAFEFAYEPELDDGDDTNNGAVSFSKEENRGWMRWPLAFHISDIPLPLPTPRILWLIYSQNIHDKPESGATDDKWAGNIRDLKDIPDSASIMSVAEMEKNWPWICPFPISTTTTTMLKDVDLKRCLGELDMHVRRYLTPVRMSYGAMALSVSIGVLVFDLIPRS